MPAAVNVRSSIATTSGSSPTTKIECFGGIPVGSLPRDRLLPIAKAGSDVIVHHAGGLHVGVADGRSHKPEATLAQILAHSVGFRGHGGNLRHRTPAIAFGRAAYKTPDV